MTESLCSTQLSTDRRMSAHSQLSSDGKRFADASVVICTYTEARWEELIRAIEAVQRQTLAPRETIVVVDHNRPLLERVQAELPGVLAVENGHVRGLSGARNSGSEAARGSIIVFLDDDAIAEPDWLSSLMAAYDDPTVLGVGGSVEPLWRAGRPDWFPREFDWVVGCTYLGMPKRTAPVRNLIGCNMSFRRAALDELG